MPHGDRPCRRASSTRSPGPSFIQGPSGRGPGWAPEPRCSGANGGIFSSITWVSDDNSPDDTSLPLRFAQDARPPRGGRVRRRVALLSLGVVVLATVAYLVGLVLSDQSAGTCTAWPDCAGSSREQWYWDQGTLLQQVILAAALLVISAYVLPWFMARPSARTRLSVLGLVVVVPLSGLMLMLASQVRDNDCDEAGWICYEGPELAAAIAAMAYVGLAIGLLLAIGLIRPGRIFAMCSSLGLTILTVILVSGVLGRLLTEAVATLSQPLLP